MSLTPWTPLSLDLDIITEYIREIELQPQQPQSGEVPPQSPQIYGYPGTQWQPLPEELGAPTQQPQPHDQDSINDIINLPQGMSRSPQRLVNPASDINHTAQNQNEFPDLASSSLPLNYDCPYLPKIHKVSKEATEANNIIDGWMQLRKNYDTMRSKVSGDVKFNKAIRDMRNIIRHNADLYNALPRGLFSQEVLEEQTGQRDPSHSSIIDVETNNDSNGVIFPYTHEDKDEMSSVRMSNVSKSQAERSKVEMSEAKTSGFKLHEVEKSQVDRSEAKHLNLIQPKEKSALDATVDSVTVELDQQQRQAQKPKSVTTPAELDQEDQFCTSNSTASTAALNHEQPQMPNPINTAATAEMDHQSKQFPSSNSIVTVELDYQKRHISEANGKMEQHQQQRYMTKATTISAKNEQPQGTQQTPKAADVNTDPEPQKRQHHVSQATTVNAASDQTSFVPQGLRPTTKSTPVTCELTKQTHRHSSKRKIDAAELDKEQVQDNTSTATAVTIELKHPQNEDPLLKAALFTDELIPQHSQSCVSKANTSTDILTSRQPSRNPSKRRAVSAPPDQQQRQDYQSRATGGLYPTYVNNHPTPYICNNVPQASVHADMANSRTSLHIGQFEIQSNQAIFHFNRHSPNPNPPNSSDVTCQSHSQNNINMSYTPGQTSQQFNQASQDSSKYRQSFILQHRTVNEQINSITQTNGVDRLMFMYNHNEFLRPEASRSFWNVPNTYAAAQNRLRILNNTERMQANMASINNWSPIPSAHSSRQQQPNQSFHLSASSFRQPFSPTIPGVASSRPPQEELQFKLPSPR